MYRKSKDYEKMARLAIDIYLDYGIISFPIDEKELCKKIGIKLLPYSEFPKEVSDISNDAFLINATKLHPPLILYNDKVNSYGRQRYSILHEVKHYVNKDKGKFNKYDEDMADYFARYMMCPIPILIKRGVNDITTIMTDYNISYDAANNVLKNLNSRRKRYGDEIFDYEKPLINFFKKIKHINAITTSSNMFYS